MRSILVTISRRTRITALPVLLLLGAAALNGPVTHAASSHAVSSPQQCVVHLVQLNGTRPAKVQCERWSSTGATANTTEMECTTFTGVYLGINSYITGSWCFTGHGYLGLGGTQSGDITHVNQVYSYNCGSGWVLYYDGGPGTKFYYACDGRYDSSDSVFDGSPEITQVYIN